jgi:hypothetical protein
MPQSDLILFLLDGSNMEQLHQNKAALDQISDKE